MNGMLINFKIDTRDLNSAASVNQNIWQYEYRVN